MLVYPDKLTVLHLANPWGILEKYMQFHSPKTAMVHHTGNQNVHVIESFFFGSVQNTSLICICLRGFFFMDIINYPPLIDWFIHSVDCLIYTFCWHKLSLIDWLIDWFSRLPKICLLLTVLSCILLPPVFDWVVIRSVSQLFTCHLATSFRTGVEVFARCSSRAVSNGWWDVRNPRTMSLTRREVS